MITVITSPVPGVDAFAIVSMNMSLEPKIYEVKGYSPSWASPCRPQQRLQGQSDPWHWTRRCQQRWGPSWLLSLITGFCCSSLLLCFCLSLNEELKVDFLSQQQSILIQLPKWLTHCCHSQGPFLQQNWNTWLKDWLLVGWQLIVIALFSVSDCISVCIWFYFTAVSVSAWECVCVEFLVYWTVSGSGGSPVQWHASTAALSSSHCWCPPSQLCSVLANTVCSAPHHTGPCFVPSRGD